MGGGTKFRGIPQNGRECPTLAKHGLNGLLNDLDDDPLWIIGITCVGLVY